MIKNTPSKYHYFFLLILEIGAESSVVCRSGEGSVGQRCACENCSLLNTVEQTLNTVAARVLPQINYQARSTVSNQTGHSRLQSATTPSIAAPFAILHLVDALFLLQRRRSWISCLWLSDEPNVKFFKYLLKSRLFKKYFEWLLCDSFTCPLIL